MATLKLEDYYKPDRPYLSNSQLNDYIMSPSFYKRKYIDKEEGLEFKVTDAMKRGLVTDDILTGDGKTYARKVLKKEDKEEYERQKGLDSRFIVSPTYYDQAIEIANFISEQPFWNQGLKKRIFQKPFTGKIYRTPVCGLPDWIDHLPDNHLRIVDLKVTSAVKLSSPKKWLWNCVEMGYLRQAAMYRFLVAKHYKIPEDSIEFAWAAATLVRKGVPRCVLFKAPDKMIDEAFEEIKHIIDQIEREKFEDEPVNWHNATDLSTVY